MTEVQRLAAAIAKISEVYLTRVVKAGDKAGIAKWSLRLADYSTRLAVLVSAPLPAKEAEEIDAPEPLSSDPRVAVHQILAATGHPTQFTGTGATIAMDQAAILADATPQQARELALLGWFGQPGQNANVDYSLFLQYYEETGEGNWAPKEPYFNTGTWQAYLAGEQS